MGCGCRMPVLAGCVLLICFPSAGMCGLAGDVDQVPPVNAVDVQLVINAALGLADNTTADIDADGDRDAVDVQLVVNAALGLDIDSDDDGLADSAESILTTDAQDSDSDNDGISDGLEHCNGTDPNDVNDPGGTTVTGEYDPVTGLTLQTAGLSIMIPGGALASSTEISLKRAGAADLPLPLPGGVDFAGGVFEPSGLTFSTSATVDVNLSSPTVARGLPVLTFDTGLGAWVGTGALATVAEDGVSASFELDHFSLGGIPDAVPIPDPGDPVGSFVVLSNDGNLQTDAIASDSAALLYSEFGNTFSISATEQSVNMEGQLETKAIGLTAIAVYYVENYVVGVVGGPTSLFEPGGLPEPALGVMIMSVSGEEVSLSLYVATEKRVIQGTLSSL